MVRRVFHSARRLHRFARRSVSGKLPAARDRQILAGTILGIPFLILLVEIFCLIGYWLTKKYIYSPSEYEFL